MLHYLSRRKKVASKKVDNLLSTWYYIKVASSDTWSLKIEQRDE